MSASLRACLIVVFLWAFSQHSFSQLSDLHYLPKQISGAFVDQRIYLSTPETTPFSVNVYVGTASTPTTTISLSNAATASYDPGGTDNNITLLTAANTGLVNSSAGLRFESPGGQKFYVNWRGKSANQASSLTSKGRAALGTAFKWVGAPNKGTNTAILTNSLGIMATEDNTVVDIFGYDPNCTFRSGNTEAGITSDAISVTLNKGQTYVLEAPLTNASNQSGWIGSSVTSTKPIAVNIGQMHYQPHTVGSQDCAIDQIIPENRLGKEYIFVRGNGTDNLEFPVIIGTQNDTKIYVNGSATPLATINAGEFYKIASTYYSTNSPTGSAPGGNMYVRVSKEAYAVQSLGGSSNEATADLNFIAPVNCLLANSLDNIPDVSNIAGTTISGGITIISSSAVSEENITVTYGSNTVSTATLTAAKKNVAGSSDWNTYYLSGLSGNVKVSSTGPLAVGYFGFSGVAGASGYFSGFETIPTIEVQRIGDGCLPSTLLNATPGFTAYTWYRNGTVVPGINSNSYAPTTAGKFTVTVTNGSCAYTSANQYIYDCNSEIIVKTTANKAGILAGETVTFQIAVSYLSDVNVTDLVVSALVPSNVTVTGTSATFGSVSNTGATYTWNIGTMRNGEEHLLNITAVGNTVATPTSGTLTVSKTQTFSMGTEINKVADDFSETVTVYSALSAEPTAPATGLYFTNTGSAHPYNNVLNFSPSSSAAGYLIVRSTGATPGFVPVDGSSYTVDDIVSGGTIIYVGSDTAVTDYSALADVNYHYAIHAYNGGGAASNYLTSAPLLAVVNNRPGATFAMSAANSSTSAGFADLGINVTFRNGLGGTGTSLTASRYTGTTPPSPTNGRPAGYTIQPLYFTVSSSVGSPGSYTIVLDFSELALSQVMWQDARLLKRSGSGSAWADITGNILTYTTDGIPGKLVVSGLSSFSDFAVATPGGTLPVQWVSFNAKARGNDVELTWQTGTEVNTDAYEVQHSNNAINWYAIGNVKAAGNSGTARNYRFLHTGANAGTHYYRLLQKDNDGSSQFSKTLYLRISDDAPTITIMGNPVVNGQLKFRSTSKTTVVLRATDGRLIKEMDAAAGVNQMDVQHLPSGTYLLSYDKQVLKIIIR
ncbi:DUF11 domain-containing protein [Parasegetibacter sp. NRK P23]|uniref:DUF11 domain-containing protein n=1 Tax=Parasegetibacter sp. NRK P23 TaxID=2942999 RepID=UPI002043E33E|nr:DUF11 domain-containing protein [Parasegetibacter sp. NRK P23]MCM5529673.1 DUF11 domain-containing protein [Parasegetibacter sp. NRK P23]